jgi:HK97 family phage major capsid protein
MEGINELRQEIQKTHEEFKAYVDREIAEKAKNGGAAPETKEALERMNKRMDELQVKISNPNRGTRDNPGEASEHSKAFGEWLRKGNDRAASALEVHQKAMSVGSDPDGGFFVPDDMSGRIVKKLFDTTPMRSIASVQTISTDQLTGPVDRDQVTSGWVGETSSRSETNTPQVGEWRIPTHEQYAEPRQTQKFLDDAAIDAGAWLEAKIAEYLNRQENDAFFNGTGVTKPRGLCTYTTAATADASRTWGQIEHIATANNGDFPASTPADKLFDVIYALKAGYRSGAKWIMPKAVLGKIRKFKETTTNAYLWQPGLQEGQPSLILGYPLIESEDMPALATDSLSVAFGNFKAAYQVVDRQGIRVLRDPYTAKPYVKFYATKRVGGAVIDFDAVKFIKFGS